MRVLSSLLLTTLLGCGPTQHDDPTARSRTALVEDLVLAEVDARFLSFAIDTAQVVGGLWWSSSGEVEGGGGTEEQEPYDFSRPRLRELAGQLAPAYLRIGGSEADKVYYALDDPSEAPPEGYTTVMTEAQLQGVADFAQAVGLDILFTLNAGPGPRALRPDAEPVWTSSNARALIERSVARDWPIDVWELGNEINGFQAIHGLEFRISAETYAKDLALARALIDEADPQSKLAGPSSAYWPELGEFNPVHADTVRLAGDELDVVTWHYYPQQSRRCPIATRRATPELLLEAGTLDEALVWAEAVEMPVQAHAPSAQIWLGETGNAQCGGEPGVSNAFAGTFWWVDQLGLLAQRGHQIVIRQTLSGSDYGLINEATLEPRPDYEASVLWRRLMGTRSLKTSGSDRKLRVYAHCLKDKEGVAMVVLNLDLERGVFLSLQDTSVDQVTAYRLAAALSATSIEPPSAAEERLDPDKPELWVPAGGIGFFALEGLSLSSCAD